MASLSSLTTAQLETMRADLLAAHAKVLRAQTYSQAGGSGGSRSRTMPSLSEIMDSLCKVDAELRLRGVTIGDWIAAEIGEPTE